MYIDYHVHTQFSDDSVYPMEDVVQDAIRMHMDEICITDHVDYGIKFDWCCGQKVIYRNGKPLANVDYPRYIETIRSLRSRYADKITIKTGLEFGIQSHTIPQYELLFQRIPLDFVILSIHQIEDKEFWTQDFQEGKPQQEYNERYYMELLDVVRRFKHYSVLGHMDLITRYDRNGVYPFEKVKPLVEEILGIVIEDGKGIELNTSSHRYHLEDTTPSAAILQLYLRMGGQIVTIGSDSHKPEHLGTYIEDAKLLLKKLGFQYYCTYEKMRPVYHAL